MLTCMKIYSDFPSRMLLQVLADFLALSVLVFGVWLGVSIGTAIGALAEIGRQLSSAGEGFKGAMSDAANVLGNLPVVGGAARVPFDAASGTGGVLVSAGNSTEGFITSVGAILGTVVAGSIIWAVLSIWIRRRVGFIRSATETNRIAKLPESSEILAVRGLVHGSKADLVAISSHPVEAWRQGNHEVIEKLAAVELRIAGIRRKTRSVE